MGHRDSPAVGERRRQGCRRRRAAGPGEAATPWSSDGGMAPGERRVLAAMPLHAITTLHARPGCGKRLALEIAGFPDADGSGSAARWN